MKYEEGEEELQGKLARKQFKSFFFLSRKET